MQVQNTEECESCCFSEKNELSRVRPSRLLRSSKNLSQYRPSTNLSTMRAANAQSTAAEYCTLAKQAVEKGVFNMANVSARSLDKSNVDK